MAGKIILRKEAKVKGLKRYFTGKPCINGHIAERQTSGGSCFHCRRDKLARPVTVSQESYKSMSKGLTQEHLKNVFSYNEQNGKLYWKGGLTRHKFGEKVGTSVINGASIYTIVWISGKLYLVHRVIFILIYGEVPKEIDHINGNGEDNRICNLRQVTRKQNMMNAINNAPPITLRVNNNRIFSI